MADLNPPDGDGSDLAVEAAADAGAVTLRVSGQLDVATESVLREAVRQAIDDGADRLVLDLSQLDFMDSSGLAVLLVAAREVTHFEIRNPTEVVQRLITLAGLAQTLPMAFDA